MIEVVFRETSRSYGYQREGGGMDYVARGEWEALALQPVIDRKSRTRWGGRPILQRGRLTVIREQPDGTFRWMTPGATHPGGNRYHVAATLNEAQERVQRWARRRFTEEVTA